MRSNQERRGLNALYLRREGTPARILPSVGKRSRANAKLGKVLKKKERGETKARDLSPRSREDCHRFHL